MGRTKRKKILRDLIESEDLKDAIRSIVQEELTPPQMDYQGPPHVKKLNVDYPEPPRTKRVTVEQERRKEKKEDVRQTQPRETLPTVEALRTLRGVTVTRKTSPGASPPTPRKPSPREQEQPEIGEVVMYATRPRVEYAEDSILLVSTFDAGSFSLVSYRGSLKSSSKVKCSSRPSAVMKVEDGFILVFSTTEGLEVIKYDESLEEKTRDTYKAVKGISRDATVVSYQNAMYHSDLREGKLYLLEMKKNWVPGDIICTSGDNVYVATQTRVRRYYSNKNSNVPVWEHIPVSGRSIKSLQADPSFVAYASGSILSFIDIHGESHYHSFKHNIVSYYLRGKCYVLTDDSILSTYDPERKKVIDHFHLDVHDLSFSLHATDEFLYYTTGSSLHRLPLS